MIPVTNPKHRSAQMATPSRDMEKEFGQGRGYYAPPASDIAPKDLTVRVSNPNMRHEAGSTAPRREEGQRITARTLDVHVRSSNQRPNEVVDSHVNNLAACCYKGTGEDPKPKGSGQVLLWGALLLGAAWFATRPR